MTYLPGHTFFSTEHGFYRNILQLSCTGWHAVDMLEAKLGPAPVHEEHHIIKYNLFQHTWVQISTVGTAPIVSLLELWITCYLPAPVNYNAACLESLTSGIKLGWLVWSHYLQWHFQSHLHQHTNDCVSNHFISPWKHTPPVRRLTRVSIEPCSPLLRRGSLSLHALGEEVGG